MQICYAIHECLSLAHCGDVRKIFPDSRKLHLQRRNKLQESEMEKAEMRRVYQEQIAAATAVVAHAPAQVCRIPCSALVCM